MLKTWRNNFEWRGEGMRALYRTELWLPAIWSKKGRFFECLNIFATGWLSPLYLYSRSVHLLNWLKRGVFFFHLRRKLQQTVFRFPKFVCSKMITQKPHIFFLSFFVFFVCLFFFFPCKNYRLTHSASELSGFTCTGSLTMGDKFQKPLQYWKFRITRRSKH